MAPASRGANQISLHELLHAFESHYEPVLTNVSIDCDVPQAAVKALAHFCRVPPKAIQMLDLRARAPRLTPSMLLRFPASADRTARCQFVRVGYAFCPFCISEQRVVHVRWDWSVAYLIRCSVHGGYLTDGCLTCNEPDPISFAGPDHPASRLCWSCGDDLARGTPLKRSKGSENVNDVRAVEDAYRAAVFGTGPLLHPADRELRLFFEDMFPLLWACLNRGFDRTPDFSRRDIIEIIAALVLNVDSISDPVKRRRRAAAGLRLWAALLSVVPEYAGALIENISLRWPVALRRRFLSALNQRRRKRWPYTPFQPLSDCGKRIERHEIAALYGLSTQRSGANFVWDLSAIRARLSGL